MAIDNTTQIELITPDYDGAAKILREYKGRYAGRRCFVIGNGPSLKAADLTRIKENGDFSIASNRIYLIFDQTGWRPDVYTTLDTECIEASFHEMSALKAELKIIPVNLALTDKTYPVEGALSLKCMFNTDNWIVKGALPPFSGDITDYIYNGQSITYINLQIAAYLGFKEIILLGIDHQYMRHHHIRRSLTLPGDEVNPEKDACENTSIETEGSLEVSPEVRQNHFCANYWNGMYSANEGTYAIDEVTLAYLSARKYAEEHGIQIVNATRGGKLEVFDRVDFDELMSPKSKSISLSQLRTWTVAPDFDNAAEILKKYKNKYEGQRCFIVGNGPSLRAADLDKINGEFSIASHRVFLIFSETEWRPNVYTAMDPVIIRASLPEMSALKAELKLIAVKPEDRMNAVDGALPLRLFFNTNYWIHRGVLPPFSEDITRGVENGMFVTYTNLQIAMYMGFKEIILMGMDHQYKKHWHIDSEIRKNPELFEGFKDVPITGRFVDVRDAKQNHFRADYLGENYNSVYSVDEATLAYMAARNYAQEHGVRIVNATRGGKLDIFERVNFDKLMSPEAAPMTGKDRSSTVRAAFKRRKGGR